ncbi:MAG TPA: ATP-dependent protease LonB [Candidatus Thermoplasmatota archaeon]|nr:ATP-dependent protease LonB [Candidatus Thermoplasmatota archaeon]
MTQETKQPAALVDVESSDPHQWIRGEGITTTADVKVPTKLIDQVIGQDQAVEVAVKAANQKRHLLLIGDPGTGKSMIAKAMTELLPMEKQNDVLVYPNPKDPNQPIAKEVPGGTAREILSASREKARKKVYLNRALEIVIAVGIVAFGVVFFILKNDYMATLIGILVALFFIMLYQQWRVKEDTYVPKLLYENGPEAKPAPYVDATGSHAGALLGDVRHDPFQSGGLETPTHHRVEIGAIHRSHKGILFIDEINVLRLDSQQALLTAMQDRQYSIVGQSERSSGAMVRTTPLPTEFILVAAGNMDAVKPADGAYTGMHPALRSRIRGYGYEVYVQSSMDDTAENRRKLVRFVAQEVQRDGKIPHFDLDATALVIREAQRRSGRSGKLTLRLRELGGLVRTAGDIAREAGAPVVTSEHVRHAKRISRSLEQQILDRDIERQRSNDAVRVSGSVVGAATGLGFIGTGEVGEPAGMVVPVEAAVTPALNRHAGTFIANRALHAMSPTAADNVSALLKTMRGETIKEFDVHVQALVADEKIEADGIGLAAAVAAVSALERVPVDQGWAMVGTLTVSGSLRNVPGVTQMIEAAAELGYRGVIVPENARKDVLLDEDDKRVELVFAESLADVLEVVLDASKARKDEVIGRLASPVAL